MTLIFSDGKTTLKYLRAGTFLRDPIKRIYPGTSPGSAGDGRPLAGVISPVLNWEPTGTAGRAGLSRRPQGWCCPGAWDATLQPAPQHILPGPILLLCRASPACWDYPLSPPCDTARPSPACSGTSGIARPQRARPAQMFLSPPALWEPAPNKSPSPAPIPSSISGGFWAGSGLGDWRGGRLGAGRVGDAVPERCEPKRRACQRCAGTEPAFPGKTSRCAHTPAWEAAGRRGGAFSGILIPVCH